MASSKIPLVGEAKAEEESYCQALHLAASSVLCFSMQSAIELGIFDIIAKQGPDAKLSSSEIAAHVGAKNPEAPAVLDRLLRLLACHDILDCSIVDHKDYKSVQRLYSLTPVSKHYVTNEDGVSFGPVLALNQDPISIGSWFHMKDAVIEGGIPFGRAHNGMHTFQYAGVDQRFNSLFNTAMFNHSTKVMGRILDLYKGFDQMTSLVDVGGNLGGAISRIVSKHPHIKGINFDLPHVIKDGPSIPGVQHVGGDMFASIPSAEGIFLKFILHDWFDEDCIKLLKNCYEALPYNGKVIVVEGVLPCKPETSLSAKTNSLHDLLMLLQSPGGKERSPEEFLALATAAGFSGIRYACFAANCWVMEFYK